MKKGMVQTAPHHASLKESGRFFCCRILLFFAAVKQAPSYLALQKRDTVVRIQYHNFNITIPFRRWSAMNVFLSSLEYDRKTN